MRGPNPPVVELADGGRQELEALTRRHSTPQQLVLRARILLAAADGANNGQIACHLDVSVDMVRRWRERWLVLQPASLEDLPVPDRLTDAPAPANRSALRPNRSPRLSPWPAIRLRAPSAPSASGPAASSLLKSNNVALCPRFQAAMPRACSKGGSQTASDPLLADAAQRRPV